MHLSDGVFKEPFKRVFIFKRPFKIPFQFLFIAPFVSTYLGDCSAAILALSTAHEPTSVVPL